MTAESDYWTHSRNSDDQVGHQVKRPGNIQLAVLWQVFMGIVPPLPVWGISMQGCLASQRGQHTDAMERNHHGKSTVTAHQGRTSSSPPTSYSSDKEKMPPPEHGQHVSHA